MAEFDPHQLDQLEDALERLDDHDLDLESLELPAEMTERLSEYQDVLALCRDAFPLESPREELLTSVLAEAREVSRRPRSRETNQRSAWRRFWERWRGTVVPGFALATTAVVVLLVLDPQAELEQASELSSDNVEHSRDSNGDLERTQPASESSNGTAGSSEIGKSDEPSGEATQPIPESTVEQRTDPTAGDRPETNPKPSGAGKPPTKSKLDDSADDLDLEPEPTPMNKDETWTNLERADSARRSGNCDRARSLYDDVIAASSDALAIAQAKGGIGLCFEQDRRDSEATKWFNDARAASPGIDAWINSQRDEQPLPGERKKAQSKKDHPFEAESL